MNKLCKISSSPERNTFQKRKYIERCEKEGKEPSQDFLDQFLKDDLKHKSKFDNPESRVNNLEYDLLTTEWILEKVRNDEAYAQNLYASMCNTDFVKNDLWPILKQEKWSCTWRYAGGIIADMLGKGDYIDWYCSGIPGHKKSHDDSITERFVGEGCVTDEIRDDLLKLGWVVNDDDNLV